MNNDPFDRLYAGQEQKEPLIKRYGKRIAGGIACSAFVAVIMHLSIIKVVIVWIANIIVFIFGKPDGTDKIEDRIARGLEKGKHAIAKEHHPEGMIPKGPLKFSPIIKQASVIKEDINKVVEVKKQAEKGVEAIKETGGKVADALNNVGDRAKQGIAGAGAGVSDFFQKRKEEKEKAHHDQLVFRANAIKFKIDESWSLVRLEAEVEHAEALWYKAHGPNAQCPNPKCRRGLVIHSKHLNERIRCSKCGAIFSRRQALALGQPPRPRTFRLFR